MKNNQEALVNIGVGGFQLAENYAYASFKIRAHVVINVQ